MKQKLLLLLLLISGMLSAQEPYRNLIFTEVRMDDARWTYAEITNMGNQDVNLSEFELGSVGPWTEPWAVAENEKLRLPNRVLKPGESFLFASIDDIPFQMSVFDPERWLGRRTATYEMMEKADIQLHIPNAEWGNYPEYDSVSTGYNAILSWSGRNVFYLMHYFTEGDSAVVDAVNAIFTSETSPFKVDGPSDAAGVTGATGNRILVRKFSVTQGTGDDLDSWTRVAGIDIADSEWLPLRFPQGGPWGTPHRKEFWTLGNHGNFTLTSESLKSKNPKVQVDFANSTITVPYGSRNLYYMMNNFEYADGLAWFYSYSAEKADSAFTSARTNDTLSVYAVGNTLQTKHFKIIAQPSTEADNTILPKVVLNYNNARYRNTYMSTGTIFEVTQGLAMDTIMAGNYVFGIPYATRVDTVMKYMEIPSQATAEVVFVDGVERPDLKNGDKLKVTAGNGTVKEYFIKVQDFIPSHNANLSAITWPDIPDAELYEGWFNWKGDTIPNFDPATTSYSVTLTSDVMNVPALVPLTEALNTSVEVDRAKNLTGTIADRTATFVATAQDDTTHVTYKVVFNKEKDVNNIQPWPGEPFISQFSFRERWANNYIELVNPGTQVMDMSNYMLVRGGENPATVISWYTGVDEWADRFNKYIPGYVWVDEANWQVQPAIAIQDWSVDPMVQPGDVFVMAYADNAETMGWNSHWIDPEVDINLRRNPWNETIGGDNAVGGWLNATYYLFKIENDSIKAGLKPASDPNDFEILDVWGMGDWSNWVVAGSNVDQVQVFYRKPHIYQGNTEFGGSFGTNKEDSEWIMRDRAYWATQGYGWPRDVEMTAAGLGVHNMDEVTIYKSTVASNEYKVSEGYSMEETIRGVREGTTVADFLSRIFKANPGQTLTLKSAANGSTLGMSAILNDGDLLHVLAADSVYSSQYILSVTERGLSNNAFLTSEEYFISTQLTTGGIFLIPQGTLLSEVVANVNVPEGATMTIIDENDAWVSFKKVNYDSTYTDVVVSDKIFFEVIAENGVTKVVYQLILDANESDAWVNSTVYTVDQTINLIQFVPRGTDVEKFLNNLFAATGATVKVVDKSGLQRVKGGLAQDDMVVVTSEDGTVTRIYYLEMLRQQFVAPNYQAFVLSDVYNVDQLNKVIAGPKGMMAISEFFAQITPSLGANVVIVDKNGQTKASDGVLRVGDVVVVTSADGKAEATYALQLDLTSSAVTEASEIRVYPNPTNGAVNVSGAETGHTIRVLNMMGSTVREIVAGRAIETLSLDNQPAGLYFIVISNGDRVTGNYKVVKQ